MKEVKLFLNTRLWFSDSKRNGLEVFQEPTVQDSNRQLIFGFPKRKNLRNKLIFLIHMKINTFPLGHWRCLKG